MAHGSSSAAAAVAGCNCQPDPDQMVSRESAMQALNSVIQLHFDRTLEKKRDINKQKQQLFRLFHFLFIFLALLLSSIISSSSSSRLQCRHCWIPIGLLSLAHMLFYVSVAHSLRCVNGLKYQRRCHKLTLALATERLRCLMTNSTSASVKYDANNGEAMVSESEFEISYQEPPRGYLAKFKRTWAIYFSFLICTFGFMVSASVVILCF